MLRVPKTSRWLRDLAAEEEGAEERGSSIRSSDVELFIADGGVALSRDGELCAVVGGALLCAVAGGALSRDGELTLEASVLSRD